jgi:hypothetical protein
MNAQSLTFTTSIGARRSSRAKSSQTRLAGRAVLVAMLLGLCTAQVAAMRYAGPAFAPDAETVLTF